MKKIPKSSRRTEGDASTYYFYFQGEPLINKNLANLINYAHKAKIFTSTSTNAQLLNSDKAREIVLSGLDKLIISIDGSTQEVYENTE